MNVCWPKPLDVLKSQRALHPFCPFGFNVPIQPCFIVYAYFIHNQVEASSTARVFLLKGNVQVTIFLYNGQTKFYLLKKQNFEMLKSFIHGQVHVICLSKHFRVES